MAYYNQHNTWNFWHTYIWGFPQGSALWLAATYITLTCDQEAQGFLGRVHDDNSGHLDAISFCLTSKSLQAFFFFSHFVFRYFGSISHTVRKMSRSSDCVARPWLERGETAFSCGNTLILRFGVPKKKDFYGFLDFLCLKWRANPVWVLLSALPTQSLQFIPNQLWVVRPHMTAQPFIHVWVDLMVLFLNKAVNYTVIMGWACVQPFQGCPINCMSKSMISHLDSGSHRVNYVNSPVLLRLTNVILSECWLVFMNITLKELTTRSWEAEDPHWNRLKSFSPPPLWAFGSLE